MKIGILTQPLGGNYGGTLQAYALVQILTNLGHDAIILQRVGNEYLYTLPKTIDRYIKNLARRIKGESPIFYPYMPHWKRQNKGILDFVESHLNTSPYIYTSEDLRDYVYANRFDAIIIGSDQVWRPRYSPCIYDYFGNFNQRQNPKKTIAYGASFGVSNWEFTDEETIKCRELVKTFFAVSVREQDAIFLCEKKLGRTPQWVLDPTMLLEKEYYYKLASGDAFKGEEYIFAYILDRNELKHHTIAKLKALTGLTVIEKHISIQNWISGMIHAKYVITDSFHGCVFSIIFNKPFWVIVNKKRGSSRFGSLLKLFNMESRMIENVDAIDVNTEIDWSQVNAILKDMRANSLLFLNDNLK